MTPRLDRRGLIIGLGAAGLTGCAVASDAWPRADRPLDLAALEARHGGRVGVSVQTGARRAHWRGDERFLFCSTFKLFLAAAVLERVQRGDERLGRQIPVTADDMVFYAPVTEPAVGGALTVERLCQAMVEVSDNPAANLMIRELGGLDAWRAWYAAIGDTVTRVDRMETALNGRDGDKDTTTANQTVANLHHVLLGDRLVSDHRRLLEGWLLASPTGANRIKAGVPAGWRVAHKTGTGGNGPANDIGLLRPPSGDPVRIAIYADLPDATPAQRDSVIADATRLALEALGHG